MKKLRTITAILTIISLIFIFTPVIAQDYGFEVPEASVNVHIETDGTVTLEYEYVFNNLIGSHIIDYVDIGLPTSQYSLSNVIAEVNGNKISDIQSSPYVSPGIALGLGSNSIQSGNSGRVAMRITGIRGMLYEASTDETESYASFQFRPNYFESEFVSGSTNMIVTLHLPAGLTNEEPRYFTPKGWPGSDEPASGYDEENRVIYQWSSSSASASSQYIFGASFPARLVPVESISTQQSVTFNPGDILAFLIPFLCIGIFVFLLVFIIIVASKSAAKRKLQYLPPKIAVEGHGIKRGLTPIEVAILMEQPMDKILTMILFSVLKKEAATVVKRDPLEIKAEDKLPEGLQDYETNFIMAFLKTDALERRKSLQDMMVSLVQTISEKMKGFSRKETIDYYQSILKQAWAQIEAADTPEVKSEKYAENMDWSMLDKDYDDRTRRTFGTGPVWMPYWWWRADPTVSRPTTSAGRTGGLVTSKAPSGGKSVTINLPRLPGADAAASVVGTVQVFSNKVVGNLNTFTGGITDKTNPLPKTTSTGWKSSGGGGSHCACACACAGCACACAGGGR